MLPVEKYSVFIEEAWFILPDNFEEISKKYIEPLDDFLSEYSIEIDHGLVIDITNLVMMIWQKWFTQQYDYVASSFPRDDIDSLFRAKLSEVFTLSVDT